MRVDFQNPIDWPDTPFGSSNVLTTTSTSIMDASGEKIAVIFRVAKAATIHKIHFVPYSITQNQTVRVSLQALDPATKYPDGVALAYRNITVGSAANGVKQITGILSSDGTDGGTKVSVSRNQMIAVVFEWQPWATGNIMRISALGAPMSNTYGAIFTASWATVSTNTQIIVELSDGTYLVNRLIPCCSARTTVAFASNSTPSERGFKFVAPTDAWLTGIEFWATPVTNGAYKMNLYDGAGNLLVTNAVADDCDWFYTTNLLRRNFFDSEYLLKKGQTYYLMIAPTTTTANSIAIYYYAFGSVTDRTAITGDATFMYAEKTGASTFTDYNTRHPGFALLFSAVFDNSLPSVGKLNRGLN